MFRSLVLVRGLRQLGLSSSKQVKRPHRLAPHELQALRLGSRGIDLLLSLELLLIRPLQLLFRGLRQNPDPNQGRVLRA